MNLPYKIPKGTIKSADEIKKIEESCRIVADTLVLLNKYVVPDVETRELDKIAEDYIRSRGGIPAFKGYESSKLKFPSSLCISINEEVIHGIPGKRKLIEGDIVSVDCGVIKDGYYGDSAITYSVGEVSESKRKLMEVTERALELGIANAVERNNIYEVSRAIQSHAELHGYSLTREYCGHGVGTHLHEFPPVPNFVPPLIQRKQFPNVKLINNMVIAIEPMVHAGKKDIYVTKDGWTVKTKDGSPAAHFEHTVVINGNEALILTDRK